MEDVQHVDGLAGLEFDIRIAYLAKRLNLGLTVLIDAALTDLDLTSSQFGVLALLGAGAGTSQTELAQLAGVSNQAVSGLIDRLAARGFVERSESTEDRRRRQLRLTPRGRDLISVASSRVQTVEEQLLEVLSLQQQTALIEACQRLVASIDEKTPA